MSTKRNIDILNFEGQITQSLSNKTKQTDPYVFGKDWTIKTHALVTELVTLPNPQGLTPT